MKKTLGKKNFCGSAIPFMLIILAVFSLMQQSCKKEDPIPEKEPGKLIVDVGVSLKIEEVDRRLKSAEALEDFRVTIYHSDGTEALSFQTVSLLPDTIELQPGDYYVEAHSDNNLPAAFENPYYFGASEVVTVSSNSHQAVEVICSLANTIVTVLYSSNVSGAFSDYSTTVSSSLDSLVYAWDETRAGYFQPMPLNIRVNLTSVNTDGSESEKILLGSIPDPQANMHYEISVDASPDHGSSGITVLMDSTAIPVEVVEINEGSTSVTPPAGAIAYGDLLITEIMPNPAALSDTEGEWFEIYNASSGSIDLENLIIQRNGSDSHTISGSIVLNPGEYHVFARTATAVDVVNTYVYGSSISLTNSGSVLSIYNADEGSGPGALIFSVDYGAAGFPSASGASLCLDPALHTASEATLGTSWCTSTSVYNTGDNGTPGLVNDSCQ